MIKAIIFDCFGVVISDSLETVYTSLGGDFKKDLPKIRAIQYKSDKGEILSSAPHIAELLNISEDAYKEALSADWRINYELLEYIDTVLRPKYRVAMLSNVGKGRLPQIFGEGFLEKYFEEIVASGEIGWAKPEAQAYETVADRLGVRLDECVFTDDREEYIEGAEGVGMSTILFKDFNQFTSELEKLLQSS